VASVVLGTLDKLHSSMQKTSMHVWHHRVQSRGIVTYARCQPLVV